VVRAVSSPEDNLKNKVPSPNWHRAQVTGLLKLPVVRWVLRQPAEIFRKLKNNHTLGKSEIPDHSL
jgi:hypothetical protein